MNGLKDTTYTMNISALVGDDEAEDYATEFMNAAKESGWTINDGILHRFMVAGRQPAISVVTREKSSNQPPEVVALTSALQAAGITFAFLYDPQFPPNMVSLLISHK
jgi:hypothetical protein